MASPDYQGAFAALICLMENGWEFPDATARVTARFPGTTTQRLRELYDEEHPDDVYEG